MLRVLTFILAAIPALALGSPEQLEEVTVTARRVQERLLDVPVSATVLSGARLADAAVTRWEDLTLPGIKIGPGGVTDVLSIRGIASGINFGFEQSAPVFIDGVWFGGSRASRIGFLDTERVEILKGPQPIYFGKNAIAGAFGIVTRKPQQEFSADLDVYHEFEHDETAIGGVLNLPLGDRVSARLAGRWRELDGYMTNSADGRSSPRQRDELGRLSLRDAGVDRIDYLLVTHYHRDHIGGIPELAQLLPIRTFIDLGKAYPPEQRAMPGVVDPLDAAAYDAYLQARARGRHLLPKPGDRLPLRGTDTLVVSADRATLRGPLPGAGEVNETCMPAPLAAGEVHENPRSLGIVLSFGKFRFLDLGDLAGQPLFDLVCPTNRIGAVDLYLVAHHGGADASDPATFAAFRPRVAVVNNSARKGGQRQTLQALQAARDIDTWQLHVTTGAGEDNALPERIANLDDASAHWLKVTAMADGSFSVFNPRTGAGKGYGVR